MKKVELPVINNQQGNLVARNCFMLYAFSEKVDGNKNHFEEENQTAVLYFVEGLKALHQGYFAANNVAINGCVETTDQEIVALFPNLSKDSAQKALAYFHQALAAKPNYFCARAAFKHTAEMLGFSDLAEIEEYALRMSKSPHSTEKSCHLLHPGFYSASDLSRLEESLKAGKR